MQTGSIFGGGTRPSLLAPAQGAGRGAAIRELLDGLNQRSTRDAGGGGVTLSLSAFGALLEAVTAADLERQRPPSTHVVESVRLSGDVDAGADYVQMKVEVVLHTLRDEWTTVPVMDAIVAVEDVKVEDDNSGDQPQTAVAYVQQIGQYHWLVARGVASWKLTMHVLVPLQSVNPAHVTVSFGILSAVRTELFDFFVPPGLDVKVQPSLKLTQAVDEATGKERVAAVLPPTERISLGWIKRVIEEFPTEDTIVEEQKVVVTAEVLCLCSIGEGTVRSSIEYRLNILHGPRSLFEVQLPPETSVRAVNGPGIKRWEVATVTPTSRAGSVAEIQPVAQHSSSSIPDTVKFLRIMHTHDVVGYWAFTIELESTLLAFAGEPSVATTESELITSGTETLSALRMLEVERETGFLAVEARANVEVVESQRSLLTKVDPEELPPPLANRCEASILHAFKFLAPMWTIDFQVTRHEDVEVLICVVDEVWFTITRTAEGQAMTKFEAKVRNTSKQFLRFLAPSDVSVWSTEVNNLPVKPARDKDTILIPLEKHSDQEFWVEMVFVGDVPAMHGRGLLEFLVPCTFDVPVNHFFLSLYVPMKFGYGEFSGDVKETKSFTKEFVRLTEEKAAFKGFGGGGQIPQPSIEKSRASPQANTGTPSIFGAAAQASNTKPAHGAMTFASYASKGASSLFGSAPESATAFQAPSDEEPAQHPFSASSRLAFHKNAKGVLPIKIRAVTEGRCFRFERLLVSNETLKLQVNYVE